MKILLIADVHNRPKTKIINKRKTLEGIKNTIDNTDFDLIVFLGDAVHGPDFKDDYSLYEIYLREVLDLTKGYPFAYVFGNHDDECDISKEEILSIISTYDNSLTNGRNYVIDINGEKLLFVDSGSYYDGKESLYDTVKLDTIEWAKENIKDSKAILFQHIIVPDIIETLDEYPLFIPFMAHGNKKSVKFKKDIEFTGKLRERPCPPDINTGELGTLSPYLKGACFGHDHMNDFELTYKDVKMIQCPGSGYMCYDKNLKSCIKLLDTEKMTTQNIYY